MARQVPEFLFNVERWFGSIATQRMSFAEKGVYASMLFREWIEPSKTLPDDPEAVADLIAVTQSQRAELLAAWETVRRKFVRDRRTPAGRMFNAALERTRRMQRAKLSKRSEDARDAANRRWRGVRRRRLEDHEPPPVTPMPSHATALPPHAEAMPLDAGKDRIGSDRIGRDRIGREGIGSDGPGAPRPDGRSKRPMFTGQLVTVFEWQVTNLLAILGEHADAFDLHEWFFALDARCARDGTIPPKRDGGAWLEAECVAEAQRRGLPLKVASAKDVGTDRSVVTEADVAAVKEQLARLDRAR